MGESMLNLYLTMFILGLITTITEWAQIHTTTIKKLLYMFTFPLFMFTFVPITFTALFVKVQWQPIKHRVSASMLRR